MEFFHPLPGCQIMPCESSPWLLKQFIDPVSKRSINARWFMNQRSGHPWVSQRSCWLPKKQRQCQLVQNRNNLHPCGMFMSILNERSRFGFKYFIFYLSHVSVVSLSLCVFVFSNFRNDLKYYTSNKLVKFENCKRLWYSAHAWFSASRFLFCLFWR